MDDPEHDRFTEVGSHALGTSAWLAAGDDDLLVGTPNGHLELVDATGTAETIDLDRELVAVDLGKYVYAADADGVRAYTKSGIELWSTAIESPRRLATLARDGVVACLCDDGRLVGLDTETGTDLFDIERPHADVDQLNAVASGQGLVAIAAWSFLSVVDADGTVRLDENLASAIEDVAVVDDGVVVLLKNGDVQRIDVDTGDSPWTRSHAATSVVAVGDTETLLAGQDGLQRLDAHGNADPVGIDGGDGVAATADGMLVVVSDAGTQTVYRRGEPAVSSLAAELVSERVRAGQPIRFRLTNESDDPLDMSLELRVTPEDAVQVTGQTLRADLAPGETTERAVRVRSVERSEPTTVSLEADGRTICEGAISPVTEPGPAEAVDIEPVVDAIGPETYEATLDVTNAASSDAIVAIAGVERAVEPGETSIEVTLSRASSPDRTVTVEMDGNSAEVPLDLPLPDEQPSVAIEPAGSPSTPYLDVVVDHPYDASVSDSLVVATPDGAFETSRAVDLASGERLRLAILLTASAIEDGLSIRAVLEASDVHAEAELDPAMWETVDTETGDADDTRILEDQRHQSQPDDSSFHLTLQRDVPDAAHRGERFDETVTLHAEGAAPADPVVIEAADDEYRWEAIDPPARLDLRRQHAIFDTGPVTIPEASVTVDGETRLLPSRTVEITAGAIALDAEARDTESTTTVDYTCRNTGTAPIRLESLRIDAPTTDVDVEAVDDPIHIPPGDETTVSRGLDRGSIDGDEPFGAGVTFVTDDESQREFWTLVEPPSPTSTPRESESASVESDDTMDLQVTPSSTPIAGENVAIQCTLTAGTTLSDVHVEARGDLVTPLSTGERRIDDIDPGGSETYFVDIVPERDSTAAFELEVTTDGSPGIGRTYRIAGPVAAPGGDVQADRWEAIPETSTASESRDEPADASPADAAGSTHLTTKFRAARESPR